MIRELLPGIIVAVIGGFLGSIVFTPILEYIIFGRKK
jgi:hypothetical protein